MKRVFGKKNTDAVSPVIGTILMVAITVVLAAVLYVMVSGIGPGNTSNPPTAQLQAGTWGGSAGNYSYAVTVVSVKDVGGINPTSLVYIVARSDGTACYSGAAGLNSSSLCGYAINVQYQDTTSAGAISASDSILINVYSATNPLSSGKLTVQTSDNKIVGTVNLT